MFVKKVTKFASHSDKPAQNSDDAVIKSGCQS